MTIESSTCEINCMTYPKHLTGSVVKRVDQFALIASVKEGKVVPLLN
jgi:hypothetical protein